MILIRTNHPCLRVRHLSFHDMGVQIYCNNTFIQTIYVCDVLCVITLVMTTHKDHGYD
jgi:hypothetical protein